MTHPILITGASGFLGRHIFDDLTAHGLTIVGTSYRRAKPDLIPCDFEKLDIGGLPRRVSAVIHAAAYVPEKELLADPLKSDAINARGTLALLERYPAVPWILISSSSIETEQLPLENFYDAGKFGAELYASAYASTHSFPLTIFRCSYLYGSGMRRSTVVMKFINLALQGGPLVVSEAGKRVFDFLHVRDAAKAVRMALSKTHSGRYFLGSGIPTSVYEFAATIRHILDGNLEINIQGEPPANQLALPHSLNDIKDQLGWEPQINLTAGLTELIQETRGDWVRCAS